ncbi:alpha-amylase family glycosyl hydrolase [Subtercola sp. YIM 133946]|uniref:alpha-amylase family glycosyl hydrolase n=1 Tax=Subtercola sp. YIM 133946 TaxID=3118909 RepID=UPI002F949CF2
MSEPEWVEYAVWWQVYPLGFVGASTEAGEHPLEHRLTRIVDWLDYAIELGASGIALGPVFASETHGYDTTEYFTIDPRLGDEADFDLLVAEAHSRGLRVLLDGVFNHVGRGFAPLQRALAEGAAAPEFGWFVDESGGAAAGDEAVRGGGGSDGRAVGGGGGGGSDGRPVGDGDGDGSDARAVGGGYGSGAHPRFRVFEGHDTLVELNHAEPAVADFVVEVMTYWLGRGADGWRLDAAYAVDSAFWADVLPRVRHGHPDAYFVGEVLHGDYTAYVEASRLDSVTQYEVWKAIWSSIHDANFFELDYALGRHNGYLEGFVPLTFVGNHDVTRLATAVGDARHLAHALVVLLTIGGTPSIYYGDERGLTGLKEQRFGGDDAIRPAFPAAGPAGFGAGRADGAGAVGAGGAVDGWSVYHLHQNLIGLRRRHPWLHSARTSALKLTNEFYAYEVVATDSAPHQGEAAPHQAEAAPAGGGAGHPRRLVVLLNVGDEPFAIDVPRASTLVAGDCALAPSGSEGSASGLTATTPPHGWAVIEP